MAEPVTQAELEALLAVAAEARKRAYAPYSDFKVGAAVLTTDGLIFQGANVENASYGLTMCAERCAIGAAVAGSAALPQIRAVAVYSSASPPSMPCGACRQVLYEFGKQVTVICGNEQGQVRATTIATLLPEAFGPTDLELTAIQADS